MDWLMPEQLFLLMTHLLLRRLLGAPVSNTHNLQVFLTAARGIKLRSLNAKHPSLD